MNQKWRQAPLPLHQMCQLHHPLFTLKSNNQVCIQHTKQGNQPTYTLNKPPKKSIIKPDTKPPNQTPTNQSIETINQSINKTDNQSINQPTNKQLNNQPTQTRRPNKQPTCSALRLSASAALSSLVKNLGLAISCSSALFLANSSSITGGVLRAGLFTRFKK